MTDHPLWPIVREFAAMASINVVFANIVDWVQATPAASVLVFIGTLIHAYVVLRRDGRIRQLEYENRQLRFGRVDPAEETKDWPVVKPKGKQ